MTKSPSSILLVLILAAATLAGPAALAEEAAARPAAVGLESAAVAAEPAAPAASGEALFLAGTSCAPVSGEIVSLDEAQEPLFAGTPCNERRCGPREFCCNFSCSICASIFGGACTQQVCPVRP